MPTWRKLHTKLTDSIDVNDMPDDFTRLLWVMLPLGLDREGRCMDNPGFIKAKVMPLRDDVDSAKIGKAMNWYAKRGMIVRYTVDGRDYFYVPTFHKYQGKTEREAESHYPPPTSSSNGRDKVTSKSRLDVEVDVDVDSDSDALGVSKSSKFWKFWNA